jgi:mRNA interferase MazF
VLGHEQAGARPAIVLTDVAFNAKTDLALVCPITSKIKGYPFEVVIPTGLPVHGAILVHQLKTVDWKSRAAKRLGKCPKSPLLEVEAKLRALLGL